ncbi:MAG: hypothetical protein ACXVHT_12350 [Methanobacterium sp.]
MSCYIRYMKNFLNGMNIEPQTKEERKHIDLTIREIIGKNSDDKCNEVWREVKVWLNEPEKKQELTEKLKMDL